jgi:hypothetical protein
MAPPELTSEESVRTKRKRMKKFKGFITGRSRREKRRTKSGRTLSDDASQSFSVQPDDASTVYGAELDASIISSQTKSSYASIVKRDPEPSTLIADPVQVILLIMDPETRRFELLQLEFDSALAKVVDIFSQIPIAATEEVLKNADYKTVVNLKGEELKRDSSLSDYVTKAGVVIAVPSTSNETGESSARMAIPILTNTKVHKMLISSGVDVTDLPTKANKKAPVAQVSEEQAAQATPVNATVVNATPVPTPTEEPVKKEEPVRKEEPAKKVEPVKKEEPKKEEEKTNYFVLGILFAVFAHLLIKVQVHTTASLGPGDALAPGKAKSRCGFFSSIPFIQCEPAYLKMGNNGILELFEGDSEEATVSFSGKVCSDEDGEDCVPGAFVGDDGALMIGGLPARVKAKPTIELSPWPFKEDVTYRVKILGKLSN